jgi:tetratricopeptide (TPR) repeat protein
MRRTGYLGLCLVLILTIAVPAMAQLAADNAYRDLYNEKDVAKKVELSEKFLNDFKGNQYWGPVFQTVLGLYTQTQSWAKLMDAVDKLPTNFPAADAKLKTVAYERALTAAQQAGNADKILDYGNKLLAVDPTNLNGLFMVATTIPLKMPADEAGKKMALDRALELSTKALASVQETFSKPKLPNVSDAQWKQIRAEYEDQLHSTIALVYFNRSDFPKATEEYQTVLKSNPKDGPAHFYMGMIYRSLSAVASKEYQTTIDAENTAKRAQPVDQPLVDELAAKREGLATEIREKRDKAIDELAIAVAIGGPAGQQARPVLEALYKTKNSDSLEGLDQLINQKKGQLGQ